MFIRFLYPLLPFPFRIFIVNLVKELQKVMRCVACQNNSRKREMQIGYFYKNLPHWKHTYVYVWPADALALSFKNVWTKISYLLYVCNQNSEINSSYNISCWHVRKHGQAIVGWPALILDLCMLKAICFYMFYYCCYYVKQA